MELPTYADVVAAQQVVHRHLAPTPLYEWPALSRLLGCRYYLKHENHTPTTAFKVRGGLNVVARLSEEQKQRGLLGCTTGNHGQSLAYACRLFGVRCVPSAGTLGSGSVPDAERPDVRAHGDRGHEGRTTLIHDLLLRAQCC